MASACMAHWEKNCTKVARGPIHPASLPPEFSLVLFVAICFAHLGQQILISREGLLQNKVKKPLEEGLFFFEVTPFIQDNQGF